MHNDMEHFYPLLFEPNLHETVWGGDRLTTWKTLPAHASPVGESWEVSAVPSSIGIVANGPYKAQTSFRSSTTAPKPSWVAKFRGNTRGKCRSW